MMIWPRNMDPETWEPAGLDWNFSNCEPRELSSFEFFLLASSQRDEKATSTGMRVSLKLYLQIRQQTTFAARVNSLLTPYHNAYCPLSATWMTVKGIKGIALPCFSDSTCIVPFASFSSYPCSLPRPILSHTPERCAPECPLRLISSRREFWLSLEGQEIMTVSSL